METNKSDVNVGDFVLIEGSLHEILAVEASYSQFSKERRYSMAYASGEYPAIKTRTHYTIGTLNVNKASDITEVTIPVFRASDIVGSKYGDSHDIAERLLENEQVRNIEIRANTEVSNFLMSNADMVAAYQAIALHSPEPYGEMISIYKNAKDRKRTRRSVMKPGRAFKHMMEKAEDKEIAKLTETYIESTAPREFILKEGTSRAAFRRAYCGIRAENRNVVTTRSRKALARSCMHTLKVKTDELDEDMSPAEVFASGDFMVAWLETTDKKIAARVVFSIKAGHDKTHAPIYGACEQSINELKCYMQDMEVSSATDWEGMRLLRIETRAGQVGPYMDCGIQAEEAGDYLELTKTGTIQLESTDGYTSDGVYCDNCGEAHCEQDMRHTPDDNFICVGCFDECFMHLSNGDVVSFEEAVEACSYNKSTGRTRWDWIHIYEAVYCEELNEYWSNNCVTQTDEGDEWIPTHMIDEYPEHFSSYVENEE